MSFKKTNKLSILKIGILAIFYLFLFGRVGQAQTDSTSQPLRVSLLTVGVGDEIYASFGHTGIRIVDSAAGTDRVYNWGTFDGFQENFELKFMRGKLLYYCSVESFLNFYQTYVREQRRIQEQVLLLPPAIAVKLRHFLEENLSEESRYYKYDFLFDNCATRQRDVFQAELGKDLNFGEALPVGTKLSFRSIVNQYLAPLPWERLGINLLLGSKLDKTMSNTDAMFLPDLLRNAVAGAKYSGRQLAAPVVELLPAGPAIPAPGNSVLWAMLGFAAVVIFGAVLPGFNIIGVIARNILLVGTSLLGGLMLFMWLGTDHKACADNFNVLWALPTNMIIPFVKRQKRSRYALVAIFLIILALALHFIGVQRMPLGDIWPLLLALLFSFGMMYKQATTEIVYDPSADHH